jgi:hypothetical protein
VRDAEAVHATLCRRALHHALHGGALRVAGHRAPPRDSHLLPAVQGATR